MMMMREGGREGVCVGDYHEAGGRFIASEKKINIKQISIGSSGELREIEEGQNQNQSMQCQ